MINIEVRLFANLQKYAPPGVSPGAFAYRVEEGATLEDLRQKLEIPREECKQAFVNHYRREWDYRLQEGDRVALFSPIAGG